MAQRGAQSNTDNRFQQHTIRRDELTAIDEWEQQELPTSFIEVTPKSIVNKVESPDIYAQWSMNPYQGCEHGCIYCYARNSFEYWGYSAGVDFEQKILVKTNAPQLLKKFLSHPKWEGHPIMLSGNTDCYQPAERKYKLTQQLLQVCNLFHQPLGIITKNAGILRDIDLLKEMATRAQVSVMITVTTLNESLRKVMEPRTATGYKRLKVIETLSKAGIPTGVMVAPIVPGLNDQEIPAILKAAANAGAGSCGYTFIRLNGAVKILFREWLFVHFPDRADKVWHLIEDGHGGKVNDSRYGTRMRGEGVIAHLIEQQFKTYTKQFGLNKKRLSLSQNILKKPGQLKLF